MDIQSFLSRRRRKGRRVADKVDRITTLIGHETKLSGRIEGSDNYIINGVVEGECEIDGVLVLSADGRWTGDIHALGAIISGEVRGDITVRDKLELTASARVTGRISSPVVAIAEGAIHQGEIRMGKGGELVRFRERREAGAGQVDPDAT